MTDVFETDREEITISYKGGANDEEGLIAYKGSPENAAKRMGIQDWDGRLSSLLERRTDYQDKPQVLRGVRGKSVGQGKPGQPPESLEAPEWAGEAPICDHGQPRRYKCKLSQKDNLLKHMWECAVVAYPDPNQCKTIFINQPK